VVQILGLTISPNLNIGKKHYLTKSKSSSRISFYNRFYFRISFPNQFPGSCVSSFVVKMKWVEDGKATANTGSEKKKDVTANKSTKKKKDVTMESTTTQGNVVNGKIPDKDVSK